MIGGSNTLHEHALAADVRQPEAVGEHALRADVGHADDADDDSDDGLSPWLDGRFAGKRS